ncbi:transcriptional regulator [Mycobacterium sp. JS623]|uniref:TetR/AcrR family transcriptional regulator n=1 Tax=Mycobacterium sp. JS623 TaxID=212767 RepID=UPI0002A5B041|nr:TetR/AcrR family transcriptional regulator [Mycobacterium sp. JS623]AGB26391.1 transcriptional regulator [Mycobacterium sp. JS623]
MTTVSQPRAARGRRATRPSGDDRELAIFATLERLLQGRSFAEISVDDLAKGAGISRPTFYFYFPSKDAVLLTLFERVLAEADATFEGSPEDYAADPARAWRDGIYAFFEPLRAHLPVALAGVAATGANAEIRELWSTFMQKWVDRTAAVITAERVRGAAPESVPAQDLAAALNLMNERTMFASYTGQKPSIVEDAALDTLVYVWITSIYGRTP